MTKFNQARRLEDQHVAQKQLQLSKSPERPSHKPQPARQSPKSGASVSAALNQQQAGFDVLVSKVPRQQRTHATYRKESVTGSLSGDLPGKGTGHEWAPHTCSDPEHGAGVSGKHRKSHPHAAPKQHSAAGKQLPKPTARCASTPAELMLQANLVLEQLERVQAEAACSQQDCSNHHAASSQGHSPAHPAHETSACSKQHKDSTAKQHVGLDGTLPAGQQQDSRPAPPEPTSSSTTFAQDGMPSKPPASAKAAEASVGARQLLSADKSSGDKSSAEPISTGGDPRHVTSPFALPAQQANAPHEEPVAGACHLSNHEDMRSQGRAERPKLPASVSQSYVEMEREQSGSPVVVHDEDDRPPCSQSRHMSPHPGRQPRPDSAAASTIMHSDSHIVVDAPQGPQGSSCHGNS